MRTAARSLRSFVSVLVGLSVVAVAAAVAAGAVFEVPPFSSLTAAREAIKDSWRPRSDAGPGYGQGLGRMTLEELCAQEDFDLSRALEELGKLGFRGGPQTTLREVGDQLGIRPSEVPGLLGLSDDPVFRGRARGRGPR